jgi:hypothetical protein
LDFEMNEAMSLGAFREIVRGIHRCSLAATDNHHAVAGHADFWQNMRAEDDGMFVP